MALLAELVVDRRELDWSPMIEVACRAWGTKSLIGFVRRRVVACQAGGVGHVRTDRQRLGGMASLASLSEQLVRRGERPAAVRRARAGGRQPGDERQCENGGGNRQDRFPAPEGMEALEVLHVDALGERF